MKLANEFSSKLFIPSHKEKESGNPVYYSFITSFFLEHEFCHFSMLYLESSVLKTNLRQLGSDRMTQFKSYLTSARTSQFRSRLRKNNETPPSPPEQFSSRPDLTESSKLIKTNSKPISPHHDTHTHNIPAIHGYQCQTEHCSYLSIGVRHMSTWRWLRHFAAPCVICDTCLQI